MNENNSTLKLLLGVAAVAIVLLALWRVLIYAPNQVPARPVGALDTAAPVQPQEKSISSPTPTSAFKWDELLPQATPAAAQAERTVPTSQEKNARQPLPAVAAPTGQATRPTRASAMPVATGGKRFVNTNFYDTDKGPSVNVSGQVPSGRSAGFVGPTVGWNANAQDAMKGERVARMLPAYLQPNRAQQERMQAQLEKLSAGIERAVARVMMPKSKKEQMIEKYAAKPAQDPAATALEQQAGAFAPVVRSIASQKQAIANSFGSAFGAGAAAQASHLMDSFASEVAAAAGDASSSPEQKAQRIKNISKKYQDKMNKLEEKSQYDKFVADRIAQDNQEKEALRARYDDPALNNQLAQIIDQAREKELALIAQNLPREEYYEQLAQVEQEKRNQSKDAIAKANQPLTEWFEYEKEKGNKILADLKAKEERGEIESIARAATPNEIMQKDKDIAAQTADIRSKVTQSFGPQAAQEFESIIQDYKTKVDQLYTQELSVSQRQDQQKALLNEVNRALLDKQMEKVQQMDLPAQQKEKALAELRELYNNIN